MNRLLDEVKDIRADINKSMGSIGGDVPQNLQYVILSRADKRLEALKEIERIYNLHFSDYRN